jgi:DNA polymerase
MRTSRQEGQGPSSARELGAQRLAAARAEAAGCRACDLWAPATQTVFGEGPADAPILVVGEEPGDKEDLAGEPFIGPAGKLLRKALAEAGLDADSVYLTNAVKHFKFRRRGKRRLHEKPDRHEVTACHPWLETELAAVAPRLVLCLGATAVLTVFDRVLRIGDIRGRLFNTPTGIPALVTVHPAAILREPSDEGRHAAYAAFVADLRIAARFVTSDGRSP